MNDAVRPDANLDRLFGRGRLRMVTGRHVEVFREEARPGERRRYTKRFLATDAGDFRAWTEREWRILARLFGHGIACVPEVARFDRGGPHEPAVVQTYDAGVTVDHWATLLPVQRDGRTLRHVFEDCAHWWALARHLLLALDAIHELRLVHLDLKADNVCIPASPPDFDPAVPGQPLQLRFGQLALIDFAFSLVCGDPLATALPLARQPDYDYQSPRLLAALQASRNGDLRPTRELDWRCDFYSLAALLSRYLPVSASDAAAREAGWTAARLYQADNLLRRLHAIHDAELPAQRPHADLADDAAALLRDPALADSLARGWVPDARRDPTALHLPTPITRIAQALPATPAAGAAPHRPPAAAPRRWTTLGAGAAALVVAVPLLAEAWKALSDDGEATGPVSVAAAPSAALQPKGPAEPAAPVPAAALPAASAAPGPVDKVHASESSASGPPSTTATATTSATTSATAPASASATTSDTSAATSPTTSSTTSPPASPATSAATSGSSPDHATASVRAAASSPAPAPPGSPQADRATVAAPASPATRAALRAAPATAAAGAPPAVSRLPSRALTGAGRDATPPVRVAQADRRPQAGPRKAAPTTPTAPTTSVARTGPAPTARTAPSARPPAPAVAKAPAAAAERRPWLEPRGTSRPVATAATRPPPTLPPPLGEQAVLRPAPTSSAQPAATPSAQPAPAPVPTAPSPPPLPAPPPAEPPRDLQARADSLLASELPRIAERAERLVLRVLFAAGRGEGTQADDEIRQAATQLRLAPAEALSVVSTSEARSLDDAAQQAQRRGDLASAITLMTRAFAANPLDADIAGDLAALRLRSSSAQAGAARQLALHALTTPHARHPQGRLDDWTTLAIASALTGRDRDARHAWYVTLALAPSTERLCRIALNAYVRHGERLRPSIDALLQRAEASGRATGPACDWPPRWAGNSR